MGAGRRLARRGCEPNSGEAVGQRLLLGTKWRGYRRTRPLGREVALAGRLVMGTFGWKRSAWLSSWRFFWSPPVGSQRGVLLRNRLPVAADETPHQLLLEARELDADEPAAPAPTDPSCHL